MFEFGTLSLYMLRLGDRAIQYQKSVRILLGRAYSAVSKRISFCVVAKVDRYFRMPTVEVLNA